MQTIASHEGLSTDIHVIAAEVNAYKQIAGEAILEIGRRLKHVKSNPGLYGLPSGKDKDGKVIVARGAWGDFLSSVNMEDSQARRHMTVAERLSNRGTSHDKGLDALYLIATLQPEQRERPHTIPSTGAVKTVDEMTVRELREVRKALREAEARANKAEQDYEVVRDTLEAIEAQPPKVVADPTISDRLKRYEARYGDIDGEVTERISNHTEVDGAAAHFADDTQSFLLNYAHLTTFRATFMGLSDAAYEEYRTSLDALREFVNGMERVMASTPRGKAEVIDITEYRAN
ncbi:DUF3102 domain-containing protein [Paenibacillus alvei]|uniref:DUF3102 domain-containing protein n=1 Tax=Paenibacillus alvei TaxID=44250 RepID=A0ABT4GUJ2_PAEAL|nr:hypothetical protein [Paenibacillus alvei]MCY9760366.1 DUF3102 domain-containing protein [Paenibacillus alvei]MCY9767658.1 DUF3102 domain-containing protein [Paenibacillus alvei]